MRIKTNLLNLAQANQGGGGKVSLLVTIWDWQCVRQLAALIETGD